MGISTQQMSEKLLNPSMKLIEILHDDTAPRNACETLFILRKSPSHSRISSRESQQQQSQSQVSPKSGLASRYQRPPIPVSNLDNKANEVLQRINSALWVIGSPSNRRLVVNATKATPMSAANNIEGGMDIIIASGVLSSKPLNRNQTQYSVFAKLDEAGKLGLVVQKIIQVPSNRPLNTSSLANVTERDLDTLFASGRLFLNAQDHRISRKPVPIQSGVSTSSWSTLDPPSSQISNLNDLEKEFQRIITAHAI
ncbi:hypothetical protein BX666DRAFT_951130 [Dichotomocladium elegans]|nr:hypothetical protein BX666DRAFT_951130 [Dichotomocladium elegans]